MSVEKYPCVWDINNVDYHNRDIKDLAWEQICKEVFDNWENCADKTNKCKYVLDIIFIVVFKEG